MKNKKIVGIRQRLSPGALFLICAAVLVGTCLLQYCGHNASDRTETVKSANSKDHRSSQSREQRLAATMEKQRRDRETLGEALLKVVGGDERGDLLIRFHREHAYYSQLVGGGVTVNLTQNPESVTDPLRFEVTISSRQERERNGIKASAHWQWDSDRNELFLPPTESHTELWAGIFFAHELSHAYDVVTGIEPRNTPTGDPRYIQGEHRAYSMELRLIERASGGKYLGAVKTFLREKELLPAKLGVWLSGKEPVLGDFRRFDERFFPAAKSGGERAARDSIGVIAMNFLRIAEAKGGEKEELRYLTDLYRNFFRGK